MLLEFSSASTPEPAAKYVASCIAAQLTAGRSVLWLLSGGSAIDVAMATLPHFAGVSTTGLTVSLIDERYGPVGHKDSNWHQLAEAGFQISGATLHPVLDGTPQNEAAEHFGDFLESEFNIADYAVGLLGVGADGHTSGILPHSPAVTASGLVFAYDGAQYQRITTTAAALERLDEAVIYAVGDAKWSVLDQLETDISPADQPAQLLKAISRVVIFTDRPQTEAEMIQTT
jgi:6-phosphogluconolactonase/glucosamine-6-phosphate isomerase/deaminase